MVLAGLIAQLLAVGVALLLTLSSAVADVMQDRTEVKQEADRLVVDVYRVKGIGRTEIRVPESVWPQTILVRLHGFQELESFSAVSQVAGLECELSRAEGRPPTPACRVGNVAVDALRRGPDCFEVELPQALLGPDGGPIAIRWVDQWR